MPAATKQEAATIEVKVGELTQLFNTLDPSPFHRRDLDDDAEAYIVGWARELPTQQPFRIVVHMPEGEAVKAADRGLQEAFANYFTYRTGMLERDYRERKRMGLRALAAGLSTLAVCVTTAQFLRSIAIPATLVSFLAEGLIIFGWVANWRPAEIFLYEIWEIRRTCRLYKRLAAADVTVTISH